ncbi:MAG: TIGR02466 family protein [Pseudomonadota bacterium]
MTEAPLSAAKLKIRAEMLGLFETTVLHGHVEGAGPLADALESVIRARQDQGYSGLNRSNFGGWHSDTDMLDWGGAPARELSDMAIRMARRMSHFDRRDPETVDWSVRMWANVSPAGAVNMSHAHPGVLWAAVFYVATGGAPGADIGGELYFEDPRFPVPFTTFPGFRAIGADGQPQQVDRKVVPSRGDLVLFPAWMRHGVMPHTGDGDRISIAMNIYAREKR